MIKKLKVPSIIISLFCFIISAFNTEASGQTVSIKARLDSVNVVMGALNTLHIEVVKNEGTQGNLSLFNDQARQTGFVPVCGDSVELRTDYTIDTTRLGSGRIQIDYAIPVQAFDSGTYTLPKFAYVVGQDTALSNSLTFNIYPVNVTENDEISGYAPVSEPDGPRWYDWIPDIFLDYWWLFIIIVIAICLSLYAMMNYRKKGTLPFVAPREVPKPWVVALESLRALKEKKLWEQGMEKEYFTELTAILRIYLYNRFGINAMEMTTRQIMDKIYESDFREKKNYVNQILNVADFVKFAKVRPLPADSITAYENAVKFVEETIPSPTPETDNQPKEGGDK